MLLCMTDMSRSGATPAVQARHDALNRFLASVERRALRMAELATRSREDALDIVQDSMIALAERYAARPQAEWTPLFYRILQTRIASWHRQHKRRRRWLGLVGDLFPQEGEAGDPSIDMLLSDGDSPEALLSAQQLGDRIEAVLQALPLRQQQVFLLRHWEGLDVPSTARAMGCSEGSVKTHLFRAMQRLKTALGDGVLP